MTDQLKQLLADIAKELRGTGVEEYGKNNNDVVCFTACLCMPDCIDILKRIDKELEACEDLDERS